jgi:sugar/nucleoside kinase (ribokinase family)
VQTARQAGVKIALTLSDVNMIRFCREGLEEMMGDGVDLLFSNEEEAKLLFGASDVAGVVEPMQGLGGDVCDHAWQRRGARVGWVASDSKSRRRRSSPWIRTVRATCLPGRC